MIIGYLRVSTGKQHLANQQDEIRRFAESRKLVVDHWVTEVVSGKKSERDRKLGGLLRRLKKNDTLIVTEISRLSRTLTDIMAIMGKCLERGINLYTTKEGYSFDNTINSKVLCFAFGLVAEIERNLISMRTREALALRRAEGMVLGRRYGSYTKLNVLIENRQTVIAMLDRGKSIGDICRHFGLSRDTFAKFRMKYPSVQKALAKKERQRMLRTAGSGARKNDLESVVLRADGAMSEQYAGTPVICIRSFRIFCKRARSCLALLSRYCRLIVG